MSKIRFRNQAVLLLALALFPVGIQAQNNGLQSDEREASQLLRQPQTNVQAVPGQVRAMKLVTPQAGWALVQQHLYWTQNGGENWTEITPPGNPTQRIDAIFFLDSSQGWAVLSEKGPADDGRASIRFASTVDGGQSWQGNPIGTSTFPALRNYAGGSSIFFLDPQRGWLMLRLASSSNFSIGILLATEDGGGTWTELPFPPAANPAYFVTPQYGWIAGGPAGDKLWATSDAGRSWQEKSVPLPEACANCTVIYGLPRFRDLNSGVLPVTILGPDRSLVATYVTHDGGQSWEASEVQEQAEASAGGVAYSVVDSHVIRVISAAGRGVTIQGRGSTAGSTLPVALWPEGNIGSADFADDSYGWILYSAGRCEEFKSDCSQQSELLSTSDGGRTFRVITPGFSSIRLPGSSKLPDKKSSGLQNAELGPALGIQTDSPAMPVLGREPALTSRTQTSDPSGTMISQGQGFDVPCVSSVSDMQTWLHDSPYYDTGVYVGGCNVHCVPKNGPNGCGSKPPSQGSKPTNSYLDSSWVSQVSGMGWGIMPLWVGPQSPCIPDSTKYYLIEASAYSEGVSEADAAISEANWLGITNSVIYYDMEYYSGDSTCSKTVLTFLQGWVTELESKQFKAGVYWHNLNLSDLYNATPLPQAVWVAKWDGTATVGDLGALNGNWTNHQRIHQYCSDTSTAPCGLVPETYGGVTIGGSSGIDGDVEDGPVVSWGPDLPPPTLLSPSNGLSGVPLTQTFTWSSVTGASSYRIMVASDPSVLPIDARSSSCSSCAINHTPSVATYPAAAGDLQAGTPYYWQVHARSSTQFGDWSQQFSFTTTSSVQPPTVTTGSASAVTSNSATLGGSVNPNGADTHVWFQYSINSSMSGSQTTPQQDMGSGTSTVPFAANISGLTNGTTYYFRSVASNSTGTTYGGISSFTTTAAAQAPTVSTGGSASITSSGASVGGTVNPNGADTKAWFQYATNSSLTGASATTQQDLGSGTSNVAYNATLSGLTANTLYYFRAAATNATGTTYGSTSSFTTSAAGKTTPTVTVSPSQSSIPAGQSLSVTVTVSGSPTPTGSVILLAGTGSFSGSLVNGVATISVPASALSVGSNSLYATYQGDSNYNTATGSSSVTVTASGGLSLTVTKTGTGSGTVTSSPSGINCGAVCSASFASGQNITLTAVADPGSTFVAWNGMASDSPLQVTVYAGTATETATFNLNTATHSISGQVVYNSSGLSGVTMTLIGTQNATAITNASGNYSFANLAAGGNYSVTPFLSGYSFSPGSRTFNPLGGDQLSANFTASPLPTTGPVKTFSSFTGISGTAGGPIGQVHSFGVDSAGNVYVLFPPSSGGLAVVKSTDGGQTFGTPVGIPNSGFSNYAYNFTVDNANTIHVVWVTSTASEVYYSRSTNGGTSFSSPVTIRTGNAYNGYSTGNAISPLVASDGGGNVYVAYAAYTKNSGGAFVGYNIWVSQSTNGGSSFNPEYFVQAPTSTQKSPTRIYVASGKIYVVYADQTNNDIYFTQGNSTAGFSTPSRLNQTASKTLYGGSDIAIDPNGTTIYAVYADTTSDSEGDVYFAESIDSGATWGSYVRVNDNTYRGQYAPMMRRDAGGTLHIVWTDQRNNGLYQTYYAASTDGGATFSANTNVSADQASNAFQQPRLAVDNPRLMLYVSSGKYDTSYNPLGIFLSHGSFSVADLSVLQTASPNPVSPGSQLTYTITVNNAGPASAPGVKLSSSTPTGTTYASLSPIQGSWACHAPAVGGTGPITCSPGTLASGASTGVTVTVNVAVSAGPTLSNTVTVTSDLTDPNPANNSTTITTSVTSFGTIQVNAMLNGAAWTGAVSYSLTGPSPQSGSTVPATFSSETPGSYTLTYTSGGPSGATFSGVTPSGMQSLSAGGSITYTLNFTAPTTGTIQANATLNGAAWSGSVSYQITGPSPQNGSTVPETFSGASPGSYTCCSISGGPAGATLSSVTPSATQTLSAGGTIIYSLNFTAPTTGTIQVNAMLNGAAWTGAVSYSLTGPSPQSGSTVPATFSSETPGSYTLTYTSGGPSGATFSNVTPSPTQTLSAGGTTTYTLNFTATGTIQVNATLNGAAWSGSVSYQLVGPSTLNGTTVPATSGGTTPGSYTLTYISGGPSGATYSGVTPSPTQTLSAGGTTTYTLNFTAPGTIQVNAMLNGAAWTGAVSYNLTGPSPQSGSAVPATFSSETPGSYTLTYISGGPSGATYSGVTPSPTQTLSAGGTTTYTLNFTAPTTGTIQVNATLNGAAWSGSVTYQLVGPSTLNGTTVPATSGGTTPGSYTLTYISGGPSGATFSGVTPSPTQTLSAGGTITYTLKFTAASAWQQMPGALSQVSVGSDGTVWGINSAGQAYMFNAQTQTWQQAPGLFTQIAVGSSGFVWALNAAGQVYRYDPTLQGWDQIPGVLSQIAVGSDGDVWGINSSAQVYHFNSATQKFVQIPGALAQIAVGYDGAVWGINAAQQLYRFNPGTQNWQQMPGALKRVAVGADGDAWGINSLGQIYHFNSLSQQWDKAPGSLAQIAVGSASNVWGINSAGAIWRFNAQAQAWNQIPGQLAQIGVGADGAVWGVNSANQIYQFVQPTQPTQTFHQAPGLFARVAAGIDGEVWAINATQQVWRYDAQRQSLEQVPGALTQICVGFGGNVWGLNAAGQVLQFNPSTQTWNQILGSLAQLAVGADGSVWGIDSADRIWRFNPSAQGFQQMAGTLAQLAVGADGTVWGINSADQVWRFNPSTQGWVQIPGSLAQIAVGSANNVWGLNAAGQIWRYDPQLQVWDSIPGALTSIAVAFDGTVWGLNKANQIWRFNAQTQSWDSIPGALSQVSVGADAVVWGLNASGQAYQYW